MQSKTSRRERIAQFVHICCRQLRCDNGVAHRCVRALSVLTIGALTCAFAWPGSVPHAAYEAAHGSTEQRVTAIRWLAQFPSQQTSNAITAALEDPDVTVRLQAAEAAGHAHVTDAVPTLLEWLSSSDVTQRVQAVRTLGQLDDARARPGLAQAAKEANAELRLAAIAAWSHVARTDAAGYVGLVGALDDSDPALRRAALQALGEADFAHEPPLPAALRSTLIGKVSALGNDADAQTRSLSVRLLGRLHDTRAASALTRALGDRDPDVRASAVAAWGDLGLPAAVSALRVQLTHDTRTARAALAALGRNDDPAVLPLLASQLSHEALTHAALEALLTRAHRTSTPETWQKTAAAIVAQLARNNNSDAQRTMFADALTRLAPFSDVRAAEPLLLEALRHAHGEPEALTRALLTIPSTMLVAALSERLASADPHIDEALTLVLRSDKVPPSEALTPLLLARLQAEPAGQRTRTLTLLALNHSLASWQPSAALTPPERAAMADWLGALPADDERRRQLLSGLQDQDAHVREQAALALSRTATPATVDALLTHLQAAEPKYEQDALQALAGALVQLQGGRPLPDALRERVFDLLAGPRLGAADKGVAASTLMALRTLSDKRTAPLVARILRTGSVARRGAAVLALGDADAPEARQLLRFILRSDVAPHAVLNATLALAEIGNERDAEALLHAAERGTWPLPAAGAYALARIANRGTAKKHALATALCRIAQVDDPYVRANVAAGLAALNAVACSDDLSPERWLEPIWPSAMRVAAARWLRAMPTLDANAERERTRRLAAGAADPDRDVANACLAPPASELRNRLLIRVHDAEHAPAIERIVAVRLPDASVFVGPSDANAQVLLPVNARGPIVLEEPAD